MATVQNRWQVKSSGRVREDRQCVHSLNSRFQRGRLMPVFTPKATRRRVVAEAVAPKRKGKSGRKAA